MFSALDRAIKERGETSWWIGKGKGQPQLLGTKTKKLGFQEGVFFESVKGGRKAR